MLNNAKSKYLANHFENFCNASYDYPTFSDVLMLHCTKYVDYGVDITSLELPRATSSYLQSISGRRCRWDAWIGI